MKLLTDFINSENSTADGMPDMIRATRKLAAPAPSEKISAGDIARWRSLMANAAYDDPFPANRRLVLMCLARDYEVEAFDVFVRALADPDRTVRRRAIEALENRGGDESLRVLRRMAAGEIEPRLAAELPTDYADGMSMAYYIPGMDEEEYSDSDREAALAAIEAIKRLKSIAPGGKK